ncbi:MAG: dihydropteroate synthase [Desulfosarcinaceae bacterium]|nr:dihydropteroate synthase [Desulfosarcinaceae bacterium]
MLLVADNLRITQPAVADALARRDPGPIRALVLRCAAAGAQAIDINPGPLSRNGAAQMRFLVETVQRACSLPILLDTTNPEAVAAGLAAAQGRVLINGFSLEPHKLRQMLPQAIAFGVEIVGYLLTERSQVPSTLEARMEIAVTLYQAATEAGLKAEQLIIDPVMVPLTWEDGLRRNREALTLIRRLPELLGVPVRTIAGISNLTSGAPDVRRRTLFQSTYLPMLAAAGLDMALMEVSDGVTMQVAKASRLLTTDAIFAWDAH